MLLIFKYFLFSFRLFLLENFLMKIKKGNSEKSVNIYFIYVLLSFVKCFLCYFIALILTIIY